MRAISIAVTIIFSWKVSFPKFKVLSQQLQGTLTTTFKRHLTTEDFTDMDQRESARIHLTYYCMLLFLSNKPSF